MTERTRISPTYLRMQQELHKNPNYGVASLDMAPLVKRVMQRYGIRSLSDYGAGKCNLRRGQENGLTDYQYLSYDPAFPEYGTPKPADLVCCIDVLEHIEIAFLPSILMDLKDITIKHGLFSIHTGAAAKVLADGRNAHLIQKPSSWWLPKLCEHFEIEHLQRTPAASGC